MKYCPKCGTFINADVCSNCGWSLQPQIRTGKRKKLGKKIFLVLVLVFVGLTAGGIAFSVTGLFSMLEGLNFQIINIMPGETKEVSANLDTSTTNVLLYVVKVTDFLPVQIKILDPNGQVIYSDIVAGEVSGTVGVSISGIYKLLIENVGQNEAELSVALGGPAAGMESSLYGAGIGIYMIIVGLVGLVGIGIYAIISKTRS